MGCWKMANTSNTGCVQVDCCILSQYTFAYKNLGLQSKAWFATEIGMSLCKKCIKEKLHFQMFQPHSRLPELSRRFEDSVWSYPGLGCDSSQVLLLAKFDSIPSGPISLAGKELWFLQSMHFLASFLFGIPRLSVHGFGRSKDQIHRGKNLMQRTHALWICALYFFHLGFMYGISIHLVDVNIYIYT